MQSKSVADSVGLFNVTHLDPGEYIVNVQASGFKTLSQEKVVVGVDSTVRIDCKLELESEVQHITITSSPTELKPEKTDVATQIGEHTIATLALPNHNLSQLYLGVPGVLANFWQTPNEENPSEFQKTTVNGQYFNTGVYMIDGISGVAYGFSGFQVIVPPQDAVEKIKVTTADYDPEFGTSAGIVAQYVTKSGTNQLHGSVYWFNRSKFSFAADPFTEKIPGTGPEGKGTGPAPFNQNEGGFSLGGPIKKNKMFLFGDYRFVRRLEGHSTIGTVPNDAFRTGDFSAFASTYPIFGPLTGDPDGTGRTQISCNGVLNMICPDLIDPAAAEVIAIVPHANLSQGTDNNFLGSGTVPFSTNSWDARYDWDVSEKDKFFVRYSFMSSNLSDPPLLGKEAGGPSLGGLSAQVTHTHNHNGAINFTHTFSSSMLAEFRGGLTRFKLGGLQYDSDLNTSNQVGIPNINTGAPYTGGLVNLQILGPAGTFYVGPYGAIPRIDTDTNCER